MKLQSSGVCLLLKQTLLRVMAMAMERKLVANCPMHKAGEKVTVGLMLRLKFQFMCEKIFYLTQG